MKLMVLPKLMKSSVSRRAFVPKASNRADVAGSTAGTNFTLSSC